MECNQERLALAVRAQVAMIRADRAREQAEFLERRASTILEAMDRFRRVYRREPARSDPFDLDALMAWAAELGGDNVTPELPEAASDAFGEASRLGEAAAVALAELQAALPAGRPVLEWVGCDAATLERAVEEALAEGAPC